MIRESTLSNDSTSTLFVKSRFEVPEAAVRIEAVAVTNIPWKERNARHRTLPQYEDFIAAWGEAIGDAQGMWKDVAPPAQSDIQLQGLEAGLEGDVVETRIELLRRVGAQSRVSRELKARLEIVTQRMRDLNPGVSEEDVAVLERVSQMVTKHAEDRRSWMSRLAEVES